MKRSLLLRMILPLYAVLGISAVVAALTTFALESQSGTPSHFLLSRVITSRTFVTVFTVFAGAMGIAVLTMNSMREWVQGGFSTVRLESTDRPIQEHRRDLDVADSPAIPDVPQELVEAIANGRAILFAGFGLGVQAGLPSWEELLSALISRRKDDDQSREEPHLYDSAIEARDWDLIAQLLEEEYGRPGLVEALKDLYRTAAEPSKSFRDLAQMPFEHVFSFSWDDLLEIAFRQRRPIVVSGDGSRLNDMLRHRSFAIIKLNGDLRDADSVRFSWEDYRTALFENPTFAKAVGSLMLDRTIFFVGTSIESIRTFFSAFPSTEKPTVPHFALVPRDRDSRSTESLLLSRYNVRLIAYTPSAGVPEVPLFIERLRWRVGRKASGSGTHQRAALIEQGLSISHVSLTNIGPFSEISLDLRPGWTVFLGINGAGKSTLLKAIALALCGDDPSVSNAADSLLKVGAERGNIAVTIGKTAYETELIRERGRVRLIARRFSPLQAGIVLALGFPALRAASAANPRGPAEADRSWPEIQDVAAMLNPGADRRLDDFKQWIVNLDARLSSASSKTGVRLRHIRDVAFAALRALSGNTEVSFASVDKSTWRVLVSTKDAVEISLDQVSQGMTSLLAWIGIVIERLSEVYPKVEKPELAQAIVLVDEIDAQLHPEWQLELVGVLRSILPNVQILATTHSPLIVGALGRNEVYVCRRSDEGDLEIVRPDEDTSGMRADQILTSEVFGMPTTRSPEAAKRVAEYEALVQNPHRTEPEEAKLRELGDELDTFLYAGETPAEIEEERRRADFATDPESLLNQFFTGSLSGEQREEILRALSKHSSSPDDASR